MENPRHPEKKDPRLKPVFYYDRRQQTFRQIEGDSGPLSLPKLPEPNWDKSIVLEVRGSTHTHYELLKPAGLLSERILEGKFKQSTGLNLNDVYILTDVPSQFINPLKHQVVSSERIMREYNKWLSERPETARRIYDKS